MEYPGSKFTRPWRITLLAIFCLAFFIISPILILYTSGYRYDFQNGIFQKIGNISIDILPKTTIAYLNDLKLKSKMPIRLKSIAPGKYKIKLTAENYFDWEKEITVENKQTVYIKEIQLIKKSNPEKLLAGNIGRIFISSDNTNLLYEKIDNEKKEFWFYNITDKQNKKVLSETTKKEYEIKWSDTGNYALINAADLSEIYIFDTTKPEALWNFSKEIKNKLTKIIWNNSNPAEFYFSTKNEIFVANAATKIKTIVGKNNFLDWQVENGQIWTLQKTETTNQLFVARDTFGFLENYTNLNISQTATEKKSDWKFIYANNNNLLFKKQTAAEMFIVNKEKQFTFYGENFLQSKYNDWWIMWIPWEITTYNFGDDPFLLNRSGEQLRKVITLDQYNTLGLIWADKMTVLFPYYFVSHNLIQQTINDAVADSKQRILYFSGTIGDWTGLWQMQY